MKKDKKLEFDVKIIFVLFFVFEYFFVKKKKSLNNAKICVRIIQVIIFKLVLKNVMKAIKCKNKYSFRT